MPNLSLETEAQRQLQAMQVFSLMVQKNISQEEACDEIGISVDTYRRWMTKDPNAIPALRSIIEALQKEQTFLVASKKLEITKSLMGKLDGDAEVAELIAGLKYLDSLEERNVDNLNMVAPNEKAAQEYLTGPELQKAKSRMAATTMNVKANDDGSLDITTYREEEVLEGDFEDVQETTLEDPQEVSQQQPQLSEHHHAEESDLIDREETPSLVG